MLDPLFSGLSVGERVVSATGVPQWRPRWSDGDWLEQVRDVRHKRWQQENKKEKWWILLRYFVFHIEAENSNYTQLVINEQCDWETRAGFRHGPQGPWPRGLHQLRASTNKQKKNFCDLTSWPTRLHACLLFRVEWQQLSSAAVTPLCVV